MMNLKVIPLLFASMIGFIIDGITANEDASKFYEFIQFLTFIFALSHNCDCDLIIFWRPCIISILWPSEDKEECVFVNFFDIKDVYYGN